MVLYVWSKSETRVQWMLTFMLEQVLLATSTDIVANFNVFPLFTKIVIFCIRYPKNLVPVICD